MARRKKNTEDQMQLFESGGTPSQKDKADKAFSEMDDMLKKGISEEVKKEDGTVISKTYKDPNYAAEDVLRMLREGKISVEQAEKFLREQKEAGNYAKGGMEDGGLKDEGGTVDPVSGNDVPAGSTQAEVRDDIPAQLSEGEFVFPADVVRYIGLENLMELRAKAKRGLAKMEAMGQMGNADEATMDDSGEYDGEIDELIDNFDPNDPETMSFAEGGVVRAQQGAFVPGMPQQQFSYGYMPPQQQGGYQAPQVPTTQFPDYSQFVSRPAQSAVGEQKGITEQRQYIGPNGEMITILFMDGKPQQEIPAGYKVYKAEEEKPEVSTPTVQQPSGGDSGGDREREEGRQREYATYLTELNTLSKFDPEFKGWAEKTFPNQMKAAGAMVIDPKTGLPSFPTMSFADSMKGLFSGEQYSAMKEALSGLTGKNQTDLAYERVADTVGTKLDFYETKGLFGETRFDKERMLQDLNTWSETSSSDRTGISGVADRLSKSTGIDINPIGEQARMLAEQERGLTWDNDGGDGGSFTQDTSGIESRSSDYTPSSAADRRGDTSRDSGGGGTNVSDHSSSQPGGGYESGSHSTSDMGGDYSKGGAVQQTQRALKSSRKKK